MMRNGKNIWKKIGVILLSLGMIVGFVMLFIAASKDRNKETCSDIQIKINDDQGAVFVDKAAIKKFIMADKRLNPVGKKLNELNVHQLERSVKTYPWVKDAELFIDNHGLLQVHIMQREPLARVFTQNGNSFYIDTEGKRVPVTEHATARVPVFTGFPVSGSTLHRSDSLLYAEIIGLSSYLEDHPLWMAQIDQVNINNRNDLELIPKVGSQLIILGDTSQLDEKFNKLLVFYRQGLNNVGWGYYDTLNLSFAGQVVATRKAKAGNPLINTLYTQGGYKTSDKEDGQRMASTPDPEPVDVEMPVAKTTEQHQPKALYHGQKK